MKNLKLLMIFLIGLITSIVGVAWAFYWGGINNFPIGFGGSAIVVSIGLVIMYVSVILHLT